MRSKIRATVALSFLATLFAFATSFADPVDLRDKKGIVDPSDMRRHDPPQRPLRINEPPAPERAAATGDRPSSPPSDEGGKPGGGADAIRTNPHRHIPPTGRPVPIR